MKVTANMFLNKDSKYPNRLAEGSITLADCFVVKGISVLKGKNDEPFVKMPGYKVTDEKGDVQFKDRCFCLGNDIGKALREQISNAVIGAYKDALNEQENSNTSHSASNTQNDEFEPEF